MPRQGVSYKKHVKLTLFNDQPSSAPWAAKFEHDRILARLQALDSKARRKGLSEIEPARNPLIGVGMEVDASGAVTKNGYGVFRLGWQAAQANGWSATIGAEIEGISDAVRASHAAKIRFLVWAGMGGSAEDKAMYEACGLLKKGPRLYILDSTDPAKLKAILADMAKRSKGSLAAALKSTLVVGMAMGMTSYEPVVNLQKLAALYERHGIDGRPNFLYMTLDGSLLDQFAAPRGFRRVELQPDGANTTAGRHSAPLTRGSLYPLALAGVDLDEWIDGAALDAHQIHTAWALAAFLHAHGIAGRDKVTLVLSKSLAGAALWTKQDFEESLGKNPDLGIKIVIGEEPRLADCRPAKDPLQDRVFLVVERQGEPALERAKLALLKRAGYPVAVVTLPRSVSLSRYLQFVHYTVFGVAWLRGMNFVTQPSVELYKSITNRLHQNAAFQGGIEKTDEWRRLKESVRQVKWRGGVTLHYDHMPCGVEAGGRDAATAFASFLKQFADARLIEYGELTFFGDTRYSAGGKAMRKVLERAAAGVFRGRLKMPCDVYEGPAMNHSYHEMIIGHGRCLSTVILPWKAESISEAGHTADYHRAQFLATQMALEQRVRFVLAITVKDLSDASLKSLAEFFRAAAARLA
jgi:glucose-6-phosphate isomerase